MPRLVRKTPLSERIKAYLDPYDFLLWLAEELNDDAYNEWLKDWATPIGIALNVIFILARGASKSGSRGGGDDVFGEVNGSGWFAWFVRLELLLERAVGMGGETDIHDVGSVRRSLTYTTLLLERFLYFLPKAPLPTLRAAS